MYNTNTHITEYKSYNLRIYVGFLHKAVRLRQNRIQSGGCRAPLAPLLRCCQVALRYGMVSRGVYYQLCGGIIESTHGDIL